MIRERNVTGAGKCGPMGSDEVLIQGKSLLRRRRHREAEVIVLHFSLSHALNLHLGTESVAITCLLHSDLACSAFLSAIFRTATAGSDVVQSGRPIFDDFFQHLWPYIGKNTANVVFQMVKRLWLIRIDQ
ncbi:hypothetical protein TNCV_4405111 [Trichonephila clavipes]|uniref:Uncharacterized protein n=1 Tax=Trichonephila clavipes TaxID=2585209 RepID=A0A8X6VFV6_TRICX|nr:hypothetical protein TNCV_4405111 [Trichonephila clavipes]